MDFNRDNKYEIVIFLVVVESGVVNSNFVGVYVSNSVLSLLCMILFLKFLNIIFFVVGFIVMIFNCVL